MENGCQPNLLRADADAEYAADITIDMSAIKEPILCCPNDPDDAQTLADVASDKIDDIHWFMYDQHRSPLPCCGRVAQKVPAGSFDHASMVGPPTKMDARQLMDEGLYNVYAQAGARTEMPGCSLCMGNQARIAPKSNRRINFDTCFPNRLGQGANDITWRLPVGVRWLRCQVDFLPAKNINNMLVSSTACQLISQILKLRPYEAVY